MASIHEEFVVAVDRESVWSAIRDVGQVHTRLARGFVTATELNGDVRTVTFANGVVARERIVTVDDRRRRLVYTVLGGRATHHNASFEVFEAGPLAARIVWTTDLLPDAAAGVIGGMMKQGVEAMKATLDAGSAPGAVRYSQR
jgi:carbon monoxide dehydrogenase subunit G